MLQAPIVVWLAPGQFGGWFQYQVVVLACCIAGLALFNIVVGQAKGPMSKTLSFQYDDAGRMRLRLIHQSLSVSPLVGQFDETATRKYLVLMARLNEVSVPDPAADPGSPLAYWPRMLDRNATVDVSADEVQLIGECLWSLNWQGYLRQYVVDAVDWVRAPG